MPLNPFVRSLLSPLSALYGGLTDLWHGLYDAGWRKNAAFDRFVMSVGNLTVGGTGKTPHVEYLLRQLLPHYTLAMLSRGYGRRTKGYRLVGPSDTAESVGDEPLQVYQKFGENCVVAVGEARALAIPRLLAEYPDTEVILLDDALQHRAVQPQLSLLLTDYNRLFYNDLPFPAGRLRERRHGAVRADAVLVTKCPAYLTEAERDVITANVRRYTRAGVAIFFTGFRYGEPRSLTDPSDRPGPSPMERGVLKRGSVSSPLHRRGAGVGQAGEVLLLTGLANPGPLEAYVRERFSLGKHLRFPDHHAYTLGDLTKINQSLNALPEGEKTVITSEKDAVKLRPLLATHPEMMLASVFYLPIEVEFLFSEGPQFDAWVLEAIRNFKPHSAPNA